MSALLTLAKSLGIDPGPLNQADLQEQTCRAALDEIKHWHDQMDKTCEEGCTPADAEKLKGFNAKLAYENFTLKNEIDSLAAQVERLREQITPAVRLMRATGECSGWHEKAEHIEKILSEPSPAALSALKAEAGRDGFIRGYFYSRQYGFQFEEELEAAADKYFNYITRRAQEAGYE